MNQLSWREEKAQASQTLTTPTQSELQKGDPLVEHFSSEKRPPVGWLWPDGPLFEVETSSESPSWRVRVEETCAFSSPPLC